MSCGHATLTLRKPANIKQNLIKMRHVLIDFNGELTIFKIDIQIDSGDKIQLLRQHKVSKFPIQPLN